MTELDVPHSSLLDPVAGRAWLNRRGAARGQQHHTAEPLPARAAPQRRGAPPCPRHVAAAVRRHGRCRPLRGDSCPRVRGGTLIFFCGVNGWSAPTPSVGISPTAGPLCEGAGGDRWKLTRRRLLLLLAQFHLYFPSNSSSSALKLNKWSIFFLF